MAAASVAGDWDAGAVVAVGGAVGGAVVCAASESAGMLDGLPHAARLSSMASASRKANRLWVCFFIASSPPFSLGVWAGGCRLRWPALPMFVVRIVIF